MNMQNTNNIYFDSAASNRPFIEAIDYYKQIAIDLYGNPASIHEDGFRSRSIVSSTRSIVKDFINARYEDEITFTSGATEGNSIGIQGLLRANRNMKPILTHLEHNDILMMGEWLNGIMSPFVPPFYNKVIPLTGIIDFDDLEHFLFSYIKSREIYKPLVILQGANGEIGTVQPLREVADLVHKYNGIVFSDVTQLLPDRPFDVREADIDVCTCSSQKLGGIKGSGFIYVKQGTEISPIIFGEQGLRGGTPNVPAIGAFGLCLKNIMDHNLWHNKLDHMPFKQIDKKKGISIIGCHDLDKRINNVVSIIIDDCSLNGQQIVSMLDEQGYSISAGSACSNYDNHISETLLGIGLSKQDANRVVRLSFGYDYCDSRQLDDCLNKLMDLSKLFRV